MKPIIPVFLALALTAAFAHAELTPEQRKQQSLSEYQKGVQAVNQGNILVARQSFTRALQYDPTNSNARYQLAELDQKGTQAAMKNKVRENKFNTIIIPEIKLDGSTIQEFTEAMTVLMERESKKTSTEAFSPNFLIQDPQSAFANRKITLQLKNVPARKVLDYALQSIGGTVVFDEHATLIKPTGRTP